MKAPNITTGPWTLAMEPFEAYCGIATAKRIRDAKGEEVVRCENCTDEDAQAISAIPDIHKALEFFEKYAGMQMSKGKPLPTQLTGAIYAAMEKAGYTF